MKLSVVREIALHVLRGQCEVCGDFNILCASIRGCEV